MSEQNPQDEIHGTGAHLLAVGDNQGLPIRRKPYKNHVSSFLSWLVFFSALTATTTVIANLSVGHSVLYQLALLPSVAVVVILIATPVNYVLRRRDLIQVAKRGNIMWGTRSLTVDANLLAKYCWLRGSINVSLNGLPILQTGGQPGATGSNSGGFDYENQQHDIELSWAPGNVFYFPYELSIDGKTIEASLAPVRNWFMVPISIILASVFYEALLAAASYISGLR